MTRYITAEGNLTKDPVTGYGKDSGKAWTHVEVAVTDSIKTDDGYVDGPTNYYRVSVFGSRAENAANSLTKGSRVVFAGPPDHPLLHPRRRAARHQQRSHRRPARRIPDLPPGHHRGPPRALRLLNPSHPICRKEPHPVTTINLDMLFRTVADELTFYPATSNAGRGPLVTAAVVHALAAAHPTWTPPAIPEHLDTVRLDCLQLDVLITEPPDGLGAHIYVAGPGSAWLLCTECGPLHHTRVDQAPTARAEHNLRLQH